MDRFIVQKLRLDSIPLNTFTPPIPDHTTTPAPPAPIPPAGKKTTSAVKGRTYQISWVTSFKWIEFVVPNESVLEANSKGLLMISEKKENYFIQINF